MPNKLELKKLVDFLNSILALDGKAITHLFKKRATTNSKCLIDDVKIPIIKATRSTFNKDGELIDEKSFYQISILGLLNGYFYDGKEFLAAIYSPNYKDGKIIKKFDIINIKELEQDDQDSD